MVMPILVLLPVLLNHSLRLLQAVGRDAADRREASDRWRRDHPNTSRVCRKPVRLCHLQGSWTAAIYKQTDPSYRYSAAKDSALQASLADLATFLFEEKVLPKRVDVSGLVDGTVLAAVDRFRS